MISLRVILFLLVATAETECTVASLMADQCMMSTCTCCATSNCNVSNGQCIDGCKPGYHGGRCRNKCPENCITCTDHPDADETRPDLYGIGYCIDCKKGHYLTPELYQCQSTCSSGNCQSVNQCENNNCKCCAGDECSEKGYCNRGCKPAFPKCIVVSVTDDQCEMSDCKCCATNRCDASTGVCSDGCKPGYHGRRCLNKCPNNCISCTDHPDAGNNRPELNSIGYCTACKEGHFVTGDLYQCQSACSSGCKSCTSKSQCSLCIDGHIPDLQNPGSCILCGSVCQSCQINGCSLCNDGYFKALLQGFSYCVKCPDGCLSCESNSTCKNCAEGHYGTRCENVCSIGCKTPCTKDSGYCECNYEFTGHKCDICITGRYGTNCSKICSHSCTNSQCDSISGYCFDCEGTYGDECSFKCPSNCNNSSCERHSGDCFSCISNQTYGQKCNSSCPSNCQKGSCNREDGNCDIGCKTGYSGGKCEDCEDRRYGANCENNCSLNCIDQICDAKSGNCTACININYLMPKCENCTAGLYGENCNINCSENCKDSICQKETGKCSSGCVGNFSGETCQECIIGKFGVECTNDCPEMCLDNICNATSGKCEGCYANYDGDSCEKCLVGFYGVECDQSCPSNCWENICDQITGNCTHGCADGFSGEKCCLNNSFCDECLTLDVCGICVDGKYGQTCEIDCPMNCKNSSCNTVNGTCYGCNDGFRGSFCADAIVQTSNKDFKDIAGPVVGILLGLTIICITVAISVLYYRRRYTRMKEHYPRNGKEDKRTYENMKISVQQGRPATDANSTPNLHREQTQSTRNDAFHISLSELRYSKSEDLNESDYYKTQFISRTKIQVSSFAEYVKGLTSELFIKEFQTLPKGLLKPCTDARKPENLPKNRYNSIYPYDDDRVKLVPPGSDFINACFVDGYKKKREYIASLGPIIKATENFMSFWRMVWQENTEKIVMVTNLLEKGVWFYSSYRFTHYDNII